MKTGYAIPVAFFLTVLTASRATADSPFRLIWKGTGGWGDKSAYCSLYDPKNVETVKGAVLAIEDVTPMPGMRPGIALQLQTAKETIPVHLGPSWYLENQDFELKSQDNVEVKGSRIICNGQRVMVAAEVRKGDEVLRLRDAKGLPLWAATAPH
jgi:hypothetical protein